MSASVQTYLLALSALFSIVNPLGSAFIVSTVTAGRAHAERVQLAGRIAFYSLIVMLVALWGGAYVLSFFGISLSALRISGGLVVAINAWSLLQAPEHTEARKRSQAAEAEGIDAVAFFPLTIPFTTGPGTIAVAITLGSNRPAAGEEAFGFVLGASAAALTIAVIVWVTYAFADRMEALLGRSRAQVVSRLAAFLLLCVGTQIALSGIADFVRGL
jgi:multiple antibiotic resistance protein